MKRNKFLILLWMGIALFLSTANAHAYYLTISPQPSGGTVTSQPQGIECGYSNDMCSEDFTGGVTLYATPILGYGFNNWGGDCTGTSRIRYVFMNGPKTCTATFSPCTITFTPAERTVPETGGNFTVSVSTIPLNCSWNAYADYSWITITSGASGTGAGLIQYTVDPNADRVRQGSIDITETEASFPITQEGPGSGYVAYSNHSYKRYDMFLNWQDAETFCAGRGGYLATITDDGEQNFVFNTFMTGSGLEDFHQCWLGGFQPPAPSEPYPWLDWQWVTGEPWSYTHWCNVTPCQYEPNDLSGDQDSLAMFGDGFVYPDDFMNGRWHDTNGIFLKSFICEWTNLQYLLSVSKTGTGYGTVVSSAPPNPYIDCCSGTCEQVCSALYSPNTPVILDAIPDADSTFIGWSGACEGTGSCSVPMDNDKDVTAVFNLREYTVFTQINQGGGIFPANVNVPYGNSAQFDISVNTGYHIGSVTGCGGSLDGYTYYTGPITADCTVIVTLAFDTHTVSTAVIPQAGGSINPTSATVNHNATRQFTLTASPGYHLISVTGCGGSLSGTQYTTGQITSDCTVSATFGINTYTVNASAGAGGSINPSGAITVNHGSTPAFTVTPNPGYHVSGVNGTCGGSLSGNTYTTNSVTGNCTVQASFAINTYTVNASAGAGGGISPSGTITVNHGGTPAFTVTPNPGYHIAGVNGTCGGSLNGNTYTANFVTGNCTVQASFAINEYTVSTAAGQGGGIAPASAQVTHGNTAQFTITPDAGYHLLYAGGCGGTLSQSSLKAAAKKKKKGKVNALSSIMYTTGQIIENCTVTTTFEIDTYTVTASAGGGGSISPSGTITVNHGGTPAFTVTPNPGYHITGVNGTCGGSLNGNTYTSNSVTGNCTVHAEFEINEYTVSASAEQGGGIAPASAQVTHGNTAQFTITPDTGYHIESVNGCGGTLSQSSLKASAKKKKKGMAKAVSSSTYTTGAITEDCTVTATFDINTYTVTAETGEGGSIHPTSTTVSHGNTTQFTVPSDPGYHIKAVTGCGGALTDGIYTTGAVTESCTVSASFEMNEYTVSTAAGQGGWIDPASAKVTHGNTVQFTINPDTGYHIASVSGCGGTVSESAWSTTAKKKKKNTRTKALIGSTYTTGQIIGACTVTATFEIDAYTVTADAGPGGSIDPPGGTSVNYGATPAFTVTPNAGYHIKLMNGTCGGSLSGNTYTTNPVTGNCTVHAEFEINEYTVSTAAAQGGWTAPASAKVTHGNKAQFTITPDTGFHIASVSGCGGTLNGFVFTTGEITANCTVTAVFKIATYTVSILKSGSGSGSIIAQGLICEGNACSGEYAHGTRIIFNVQPDPGFRVADIKIDGISIGAVNTFTFKKMTGNHSIEILFAPL